MKLAMVDLRPILTRLKQPLQISRESDGGQRNTDLITHRAPIGLQKYMSWPLIPEMYTDVKEVLTLMFCTGTIKLEQVL